MKITFSATMHFFPLRVLHVPILQQELKQAQLYNGHDQEDDNSDNDDEELEVLQREGEPEEWMLLCRLNQHYLFYLFIPPLPS